MALRHDSFVQDDLRAGSGRGDRARISYPTVEEVQQRTRNENTTLTLGDGVSTDWALPVQVPIFKRAHTAIAAGDSASGSTRYSSSRGTGSRSA